MGERLMAYRSSTMDATENFFGNSDVIITTPAGAIVGDSLVAFVGCGSQNAPASTPTGWTFEQTFTGGTGVGPTLSCFSRLAEDAGAGSPPASYTFTWAGVETGLMGCILAYDTPFLIGTHHVDQGTSHTIDADHYTHDIPVHSIAVDATALYCYYVTQRNIPIVTVPAASTQRENGLWLPADLGGAFTRGALVVAEEVISGASEPAASFAVEWIHTFFGLVPEDGMSMRTVLLESGVEATGTDAWGFST